jgi:hypothetical protein
VKDVFTALHVYVNDRLVEKGEAWFIKRASQAIPEAERYHWIKEDRLMSVAVSLSSAIEVDEERLTETLLNCFNTPDVLERLESEEAIVAIWLRRPWFNKRLK